MLGFPNGWTEGESRTARLRMLGNAVQVQVAEICGHVMKGVANGQQHDAG